MGVRPTSAAAADFNQDGLHDLAVTNDGGSLAVLVSGPDGTFRAPSFYPTGEGSMAVTAGNLNDDTVVDLAVANARSGTVSILLGTTEGSFGSAVNYPTGGTSPIAVAVGSFDPDDASDLAVANAFTSDVAILRGTGGGRFAAPMSYSILPQGNGPNAVAVGDMNNDGDWDLVTANSNSDNVTVLLGGGDADFAEGLQFPASPPGSNPRSLIVRDVNGDLAADVVTANYFSSDISVLLNASS